MTDLHWLDATEQADLLRRRELSSVELVTHHLDRIESLNRSLGAFITVTPERALARAAAADSLLESGEAPAFCGVPTAFKDLTMTAGVRTSMGSRLLTEALPDGMASIVGDVDAHVVTLVERAGFISLGKTNTPEFGLSSFTDNDVIGPALTPWDPTRNAGGSSGGAAAAVAAGMVPLAPGSDGGGSIRIPSSCCGVVGFKPSRGRVSPGPIGSDWTGLAGDGTIARSVRDAASLLDAMAHPMPGDLRPLPEPAVPFVEWCRRVPGSLRIARWATPYLPGIEPSAPAIAAWQAATDLLVDLGHELVDVANPFPPDLEPMFNVIWSSGMAAAPVPEEFLPLLRPTTRYWLERGQSGTAVELARAIQFLELGTRQVLVEMQEYDAWLTPTLALPPQPTTWFTEPDDPAEIHRRELKFTPFTAVLNMAGVPAANLPLYWTDASDDQLPDTSACLPIGVMLAGRPGEDGPLFALLAQVEQAVGGFARHPAMAP